MERMCGRYASTKAASDVADEFRAVDATGDEAPDADYNVAPTKPVLAVVQRHPRDAEGTVDSSRTERSVRVLRWGLVPSWAKDPSVGSRMINARSETAADKPAFRKSAVLLAAATVVLLAPSASAPRMFRTAARIASSLPATPRTPAVSRTQLGTATAS